MEIKKIVLSFKKWKELRANGVAGEMAAELAVGEEEIQK